MIKLNVKVFLILLLISLSCSKEREEINLLYDQAYIKFTINHENIDPIEYSFYDSSLFSNYKDVSLWGMIDGRYRSRLSGRYNDSVIPFIERVDLDFFVIHKTNEFYTYSIYNDTIYPELFASGEHNFYCEVDENNNSVFLEEYRSGISIELLMDESMIGVSSVPGIARWTSYKKLRNEVCLSDPSKHFEITEIKVGPPKDPEKGDKSIQIKGFFSCYLYCEYYNGTSDKSDDYYDSIYIDRGEFFAHFNCEN